MPTFSCLGSTPSEVLPAEEELNINSYVPWDEAVNYYETEHAPEYMPSEHIMTGNTSGYIFEARFDPWDLPRSEEYFRKIRYTPSHEEVASAEQILTEQIVDFCIDNLGFVPGVLPRIPYYTHQYLGFVDKGAKLLYINIVPDFNSNKADRTVRFPTKISETVNIIHDGYYGLRVIIDLDTEKIVNLKIYE